MAAALGTRHGDLSLEVELAEPLPLPHHIGVYEDCFSPDCPRPAERIKAEAFHWIFHFAQPEGRRRECVRVKLEWFHRDGEPPLLHRLLYVPDGFRLPRRSGDAVPERSELYDMRVGLLPEVGINLRQLEFRRRGPAAGNQQNNPEHARSRHRWTPGQSQYTPPPQPRSDIVRDVRRVERSRHRQPHGEPGRNPATLGLSRWRPRLRR